MPLQLENVTKPIINKTESCINRLNELKTWDEGGKSVIRNWAVHKHAQMLQLSVFADDMN